MNINQTNDTLEKFKQAILDSVRHKSELSKSGYDAVLAAITRDNHLRAVIEAWANEIVGKVEVNEEGTIVPINYSHMAVAATCFFLAGIDFAKKIADDMLKTPKDATIQ